MDDTTRRGTLTIVGTWDKDLIRQRAVAIAAEFRGKGVNVVLGPAMGMVYELLHGDQQADVLQVLWESTQPVEGTGKASVRTPTSKVPLPTRP